jgi:hypothetical protein
MISLGLAAVALALAAATLFRQSTGLGIGYLVVAGFSAFAILYAFCAKCSSRTLCGHVLPGKAASLFKNRKPGPYSKTEMLLTGLALLALIGFPQFWLWRQTASLVVFWMLIVLALAEIRLYVCRACDNQHCPGND